MSLDCMDLVIGSPELPYSIGYAMPRVIRS